MRTSVELLAEQANQLPEDQRLTLASRILSTVEPPITAQIEEAWDLEIQRRIETFKTGLSKSTPAAEVFSEVDNLLEK